MNGEKIAFGILFVIVIILLAVSFNYGYYLCSQENCDDYLVRDKLGFKCLPESTGELRDGQLIVNKQSYEMDLYIHEDGIEIDRNGVEINESN